MDKQTITNILNTLNQIEVKGYQNINYMFGVMQVLQQELNKVGDEGGLQQNNLGK